MVGMEMSEENGGDVACLHIGLIEALDHAPPGIEQQHLFARTHQRHRAGAALRHLSAETARLDDRRAGAEQGDGDVGWRGCQSADFKNSRAGKPYERYRP